MTKTLVLFLMTALAEIIGCYLPYLMLKQQKTLWLLIPTVLSLTIFVWLLTLHPAATGRVYAAYGGVYITVALGWLYVVDRLVPTVWDILGVVVVLTGALIIVLQPSYSS